MQADRATLRLLPSQRKRHAGAQLVITMRPKGFRHPFPDLQIPYRYYKRITDRSFSRTADPSKTSARQVISSVPRYRALRLIPDNRPGQRQRKRRCRNKNLCTYHNTGCAFQKSNENLGLHCVKTCRFTAPAILYRLSSRCMPEGFLLSLNVFDSLINTPYRCYNEEIIYLGRVYSAPISI